MSIDKKPALSKAKGLIPELRFPEFEGDGEWVENELKNLCLSISSGKDKNHEDGAFDLYGSTGVIGKTKNATFDGDYILVARVGANAGLLNRAIGQFGVTDNTLVVNLKEPEKVDFIFYSMDKIGLNKLVFGSGQPLVTGKQLKELNIPIPKNRKEQQKIAACLSSLDELITAHKDKLDALKDHKKGLLQNLFPSSLNHDSKGLNDNHDLEGGKKSGNQANPKNQGSDNLPKLRFPEFEGDGEWMEKKLGEFIESLSSGVSVNSGDRPAEKNEIGILKTSCIKDGLFDPKENKVVKSDFEIQRVKEPVISNTIIISRMNTPALVGENAFIDKDYPNIFLPDRLWAAKSTKKANMNFISLILGSYTGRQLISGIASGTSGSMKNITKSDFLDLEIMMPPTIQEQQKIAACLSAADELITAQQEKIEQLQLHKKGLMQGLFPVKN